KRYNECVKVCQEFLELPEGDREQNPVRRLKESVMRRLIQSLSRGGQVDKAVKLVENKLERDPDNLGYLDLKGWVQREAGKYEDAAKTYEDLIDRVKKNKELEEEPKSELIEMFRYTLSSVYIDLDQVDKAAEHLRALLAQKPDDPTYNNDLGYIWAD